MTDKKHQGWSRRQFLRSAGVAISLPFFPSLFPSNAWADPGSAPEPEKAPQRLIFMCVPLGFVPNKWLFDCYPFQEAGSKGWFPDADGPLARMPEVHSSLDPYCQHISFFKGLSNRKYRGDTHRGDDVFLTCADTFSDPAKQLTNTVSCDQVAAASAVLGGPEVRYSSMAFGNRGGNGSCTGGLSWTESGVPISPMSSPVKVFDALFGKEDVPTAVRLLRLKQKKSVLDASLDQVKRLERNLNATDRNKLDEVTTAVRGVEANIQREEKWINVEKPKVSLSRPEESKTTVSSVHVRTMFQLAHSAFLTDSTRIISFELPGSFLEVSPYNKHALNHDLSPEKARDAIRVDAAISAEVAEFTRLLCSSKDHDGEALIHHTLAAYGSGSWGANHCMRSLPVMLIGGGGRIKQGMTYNYSNAVPLANLWLTMLQASGVNVDTFADSTGTLDCLMGSAMPHSPTPSVPRSSAP